MGFFGLNREHKFWRFVLPDPEPRLNLVFDNLRNFAIAATLSVAAKLVLNFKTELTSIPFPRGRGAVVWLNILVAGLVSSSVLLSLMTLIQSVAILDVTLGYFRPTPGKHRIAPVGLAAAAFVIAVAVVGFILTLVGYVAILTFGS
jgi:hypothetical protein